MFSFSVPRRLAAYSISFSYEGASFGVDFVLFRVGVYVGLIEYVDIGSPDVAQLEAFVNKAIAKFGVASV